LCTFSAESVLRTEPASERTNLFESIDRVGSTRALVRSRGAQIGAVIGPEYVDNVAQDRDGVRAREDTR